MHYKAIKLLVLLCFFADNITAQDIVKIKHAYYTSYFSRSAHIPILIEYALKSDMLVCQNHIARKNERFRPDPQLEEDTNLEEDYKHSGYDRGHNMSAQDNECSVTGMTECFYFSNIFPQLHSVNAGIWETVEKKERTAAKRSGNIKVFIGNLGKICAIGPDSVVVPKYCWKVIYSIKHDEYECYIFPNELVTDNNIEDYRTTLNLIEKKAGLYFKNGQVTLLKK